MATFDESKAWKRFLGYAAHARNKPSFDAEERDYRLAIAERLRGFLHAVQNGAALLSAVETVFTGVFSARRYGLTGIHENEWLKGWASADEVSLRTALLKFLDEEEGAEARFASFARLVEQADATANTEANPRLIVTFGSLFNFVAEPESLPSIRPRQFERLRGILGQESLSAASPIDQYRQHLIFASEVQARLKGEGVPVRDMIDVQSLISNAAAHHDFWTSDLPLRSPVHGLEGSASKEASFRADGEENKHYLAICAIYRDEAEFLAEWIEFHRLVGVERFFLYNNYSNDLHMQVLAPYLETGVVIVHDWPVATGGQHQAYDHCLEVHGGDSRWIAFIDTDEFLFSPTGEPVSDVLVDYEPWPGVAVNEAQFGFSGHRRRPPGLVIENYVERADLQALTVVKSIVDPKQAARCASPHHFVYKRGLAIDENGYPVRNHLTMSVSASRLRVNHYWTKSEEEFLAKCTMPDAALGRFRAWPYLPGMRRVFSEVTDRELHRYLPAVRKAVPRNPRREAHSPSFGVRHEPQLPQPFLRLAPSPSETEAGQPNREVAERDKLAEQATRSELLALRSHLALVFSRLGINCVLDVGAFDGAYGRLLRSGGYEGWVVSFEPVSTAYKRLEQAAEEDGRWRVLNVALGGRDETRSINVAHNTVLSSFLEHSDYGVRELGGMTDTIEEESVTVRALDSLIDECLEGISEPHTFLKIDTQGWDLEVLRGARRALGQILGIQTELSLKPIYKEMPDYLDTMRHLADQGFETSGMFPVARDQSLRLIEFDCVMIRHDYANA